MCCNVDVKSLTFSSLLLWEADVTLFTLFTLSWAKFWALKMGIKSLWLIAKMAIVAALRSRDEFNFLSLPLAVYQNTLLSLDDDQGLKVNVRSLNGDKSWEVFGHFVSVFFALNEELTVKCVFGSMPRVPQTRLTWDLLKVTRLPGFPI